MSAFALLFERSNTPIPPHLLDRIMERLTHRGPNGCDNYIADRLAMGHWHFWTTPEEVDERQPLKLADFPFRIVLDGRLDNRSELIPTLGLPASISDAALILHAYARWGEDCFEHFIGEYALVIHDEPRDQLICARDALGDRTLFYAFHGSQVAIASEPWAVAAALPSVELDDAGVTSYFSFQPTPNQQTLFKNVFELPPAQVLTITPNGERKRFSWSPDPTRRTRYKRDEEYAEEYLSLLEESVRARMRSAKPVGVLMSGGLDSTSVACLAARMIAPTQLKTVSFVFDDPSHKECDERIYINAVRDQWKINSIQLPCDDLWPYKDWEQWQLNYNRPEGNVFRPIKHLVYDRAHEEGLDVLLTGEAGDHVYVGGREALSDQILEGHWFDAIRSMILQGQRKGWDSIRAFGHVQRAARAVGKALLPRALQRPFRSAPVPPPWLTPFAASLWKPDVGRFPEAFSRHENLLSRQTANGVTIEITNANRHGIELRHPYRDRRLVEYALSLPAYQLFYGGLYKHILRVAMKGILPELIRTRPRPTALLEFYKFGMQKENFTIQACLEDPNPLWQKYIRADWLRSHWQINAPVEQVGTESLILWFCISFESWYKCVKVEIIKQENFQ